MPPVSVEYPTGQLSAAQKASLAEELTGVMLEIEGGGDTPFVRPTPQPEVTPDIAFSPVCKPRSLNDPLPSL